MHQSRMIKTKETASILKNVIIHCYSFLSGLARQLRMLVLPTEAFIEKCSRKLGALKNLKSSQDISGHMNILCIFNLRCVSPRIANWVKSLQRLVKQGRLF